MRALSPSLALISVLGLGCGSSSVPSPDLPIFEHRASLSEGLAAVEASIAQEAPAPTSDDPLDPEQVRGLVHMLANSTGRTRDLPLEDVRSLGEAAITPLVVIASRTDQDAKLRLAALELLAAVASPRATEHLLQLCEKAPESWIRSQAAWRLGTVDADWIVPRLITRLKYELDHETAVWMADTLAIYGNYSGLEALWQIQQTGTTPEVRASAETRLNSMAEAAGARDAQHLWELWFTADPDQLLLRANPSARLQREVWQRISNLSSEHFQLRGVDDARFVLSRLGSWVTSPLSSALHDEDVHLRVHVSQCLERMGPRAGRAGPTLVQALADPSFAPNAAAALGRVAYPTAEPVLRRLLLDTATEHELRVACAAALGNIGLSASLSGLQSILASDLPLDLRQASAIALCQAGTGEQAAPFLLEALDDSLADRFGAEVALGVWLASLEGAAAEETLGHWNDLAGPKTMTASSEQAEVRISARGELLRSRIDQLIGR